MGWWCQLCRAPQTLPQGQSSSQRVIAARNWAKVGEVGRSLVLSADVVLPCHLSPQQDAHSLEVRWIRNRLSETVHHYHNGEDLYEEQMGAYAERTELARDGLSAGSLDLQISRVRPSDDGLYICTVGDTDAYDKAIVELEVSATSADPHLSLGGYEAGGVRVLCRSAGWYPLPQLLWRDARRQHLPSVSQTHSQDQEGLFEIEGAIIVTGSVEGPLSCMVRSSRTQQERESSLHIAGTNSTARGRCSCLGLAFLPAGMETQPFSCCLFSAPFFHNAQPWMVALALVLVILAVSIGVRLGVLRFRLGKGDTHGERDGVIWPLPMGMGMGTPLPAG
uniref:Ig-like domain-containing protein n=1 Tax=Anser brachyrhynchus TaxID=132585 RepID=A0A8B9BPJ6_9AVES